MQISASRMSSCSAVNSFEAMWNPIESTPALRSFGGIGHRNGLVYAPVVAVVRSSHIGELAGLRSEKFDAFEILRAVVGTHVETFGGSPYEFALVVCTFKVCRYGRFPLLGRDRRKFGEQLFFFGISHN